MRFERLRQAGFSSLGVLVSVSLGSLLSLGYINLSRFLLAESALEQATRTAVRCVSPTNGDCSSSLTPLAQPKWRYTASIASPSGDIYGREYNYSAKMYTRRYTAERSYYSIPQEQAPLIEMTTYRVSSKRYREIQGLKKVDLIFQRQGTIERTYAEPFAAPFPVFNQTFEEAHDNSSFRQKIEDAPALQRSVLTRFREVFSRSFSQSVSGTENERLNGDYVRHFSLTGEAINLSQLLGDEEATDGCQIGMKCSVRALAGDPTTEKANDYENFRYLSLYLEVELLSYSADTALAIKGPGTTSGLIVDISGNKHSGRVCLGGRDYSELDTYKGNYFNLWLRGPAGSNGGVLNKRDIDCNGSYRHSNLLVDLGGNFRPTVNLSVVGQKGDKVTGRVKIYAFADSYKARKVSIPFTAECPPVALLRGSAVKDLAPSAASCGLTNENTTSSPTLKAVRESSIGCYADSSDKSLMPAKLSISESIDPSFKVSDEEVKGQEITLAECNIDSKPPVTSCGWDQVKGSEKVLDIGTIPVDSCQSAQMAKKLVGCFDTSTVSSCRVDTLDLLRCSSVEAQKEKLTDSHSVWGLPIGASNDVSLKLLRGTPVSPKLSCNQELTIEGGRQCGKYIEAKVTSKPQFERIDPAWRPTDLTAYPSSSDGPICGGIRAEQVHLVEGPPEEILAGGYPFDGERTLEISDLIPKLNGDKIECQHLNSPTTLEKQLREYAALNGLAEARDTTLKFDYETKSLGSTKLISTTAGCVTRTFVSTDGCPKLNYVNVGTEFCGSRLDLGTSELEPKICRTAGVTCTREFEGIKELPSQERDSSEIELRAAKLAMNVMRKFLPDSLGECKGAGCVRVKINLNPDKTVSAATVYELPLSWPLTDLLGRRSIELEKTRTERIEAL